MQMNTNSNSHSVHPADQLTAIMERIYRYRMTTTSGGNLSIRDEDGSLDHAVAD